MRILLIIILAIIGFTVGPVIDAILQIKNRRRWNANLPN